MHNFEVDAGFCVLKLQAGGHVKNIYNFELEPSESEYTVKNPNIPYA